MAEQILKIELPRGQKIIFFDGVCNLCNRSIGIIIRNDKSAIFKFASLQSAFTEAFFNEHHFSRKNDSVIYWNGDRFFEASAAALRICRHLGFPYPLLLSGWILPPFLRNAIYHYIARNRYKWFGRQTTCMVPSPELRQRFLD